MECEKCKVEFIYVELCPLHAAAGEMLEVLNKIIDISCMVDEPMGDRLESIRDNTRFIIAKAEGK